MTVDSARQRANTGRHQGEEDLISTVRPPLPGPQNLEPRSVFAVVRSTDKQIGLQMKLPSAVRKTGANRFG